MTIQWLSFPDDSDSPILGEIMFSHKNLFQQDREIQASE
jgi:hypothetical protein